MKVVLDSNIIIADWHLESSNFKILLESSKSDKLDVYVPQVVFDEVVNKFESRLQEAKNKIGKEINTANKLLKSELDSDLNDSLIKKSTNVYRKKLLKTLKDNNVTIIKYPKTKHEFLAHKAMKKIKPFNSNEKGYRDCLIWENIKSILTVEEDAIVFPEVIFITTNGTDFATDNYQLHQDLKDELIEEDFNEESVDLQRNLGEFNDTTVKLFYAQAKVFEKRIKENKIWNFDIRTPINNYLFNNYVGERLWSFDAEIPDDYDEPTISQINDEDFEIEIDSVKKLNATEYILDINATIDTEVDFFVEKYSNWLDREPAISIQDSNWNRHVMLASTNINVPISMILIIDVNLDISSIEINKINNNYRW
tara:strand:+ start:896 stop:1996 length:1101 start_codon:yes stop_codon:yes gene_type:complete